MFNKITQKNVVGLSTRGRQNRTVAPKICIIAYNFSALTNLSEMIPIRAGINIAEIPMVENMAPNSAPDHCLF
jgi:hypothetical protein